MASKQVIATHVSNLKLIKEQGGTAQDALDYMADPDYKVDAGTAEQIFNHPDFQKAFVDTGANVARQALGQARHSALVMSLKVLGVGCMRGLQPISLMARPLASTSTKHAQRSSCTKERGPTNQQPCKWAAVF